MVMLALDCETYKYDKEKKVYRPILNAKEFVLGCILVDKRKTPLWFTKPDEMFDWLVKFVKQKKKEGHNVFIYGHKHSYDLYAYAQNNLQRTDIIDLKVNEPLFAILDETGFLLDTRSFFKSKLEDVGKLIGLPKGEMPLEVKSIEELKPYLLRDVEIVLESMKLIRDKINKLGVRPKKMLTAGQLAMTFFKTWCRKKLYNGTPYSSYLYIRGTIHRSRFHSFIRRALRGARNECFKSGVFKNITAIDINSLYPYVMAYEMRMPDLLSERFIKDPEEFFPREEILEKIGVAKATVIFPKTKLGYLPVRYKRGIYFPQSTEITGYWTTFELRRALEEGYKIKKIHDAVVYRDLPFNPFKGFIGELYDLRKESDPVFGHVVKLLMNSLAGKFSQYRYEKERSICHREEEKNLEGKGFKIETDYGEDYMMVKNLGRKIPKFAHPMITILVNAYARDVLYRNLKKIADENFDDLLYCDTDSCFFTGDHLHKFEIGNELGQFKIEHQNKTGEFVREKIYRIIDKEGTEIKTVYAGITNRELTKEQLWGKETIQNRRMYSLNQGYRTGHFDKVGTFSEVASKTDPTMRKRLVPFPKQYIEVSEEDMVKAEDG
ncbi:MAG: DNA polymerase [archaeon]